MKTDIAVAALSRHVPPRPQTGVTDHPSVASAEVARRCVAFEVRLMTAMGIQTHDNAAAGAWAKRYAARVRRLLDTDPTLLTLVRTGDTAAAIAHIRPKLG